MPIPSPCRVLVVDDHPDAAESLARLIKLSGHASAYLTDPLRAEQMIRDFEPHVVLLDIAMPGIDGWTLARRIRAMEGGAGIKLVAVTAFGDADARASSRKAGFDAHVTKPVEPEVIPAVLAQCFDDQLRL